MASGCVPFRKNPENSGRVSRPGRDAGRPDPIGTSPSGHPTAATRPPTDSDQSRRPPYADDKPRRSTERRRSTAAKIGKSQHFAGADSGHLRPIYHLGFAPLLPSNPSMVIDHTENHRTRRTEPWKISATAGFRARSRPIRPSSHFEASFKVVPFDVIYKFVVGSFG